MGVSKNRATPKWMVKIMENPENPMNKWMIWGYHYFWKHQYIKWKSSKDERYEKSFPGKALRRNLKNEGNCLFSISIAAWGRTN